MNIIEDIINNEIRNLVLSDKARVLYVFDEVRLNINGTSELVEYRFVEGKKFLYGDQSLDLVVIGPGITISKDIVIEIERVLKNGCHVIVAGHYTFLFFNLGSVVSLFKKVQIYKLHVLGKFVGLFERMFVFVGEKKRLAKVNEEVGAKEEVKLKESLAGASMCKEI